MFINVYQGVNILPDKKHDNNNPNLHMVWERIGKLEGKMNGIVSELKTYKSLYDSLDRKTWGIVVGIIIVFLMQLWLGSR